MHWLFQPSLGGAERLCGWSRDRIRLFGCLLSYLTMIGVRLCWHLGRRAGALNSCGWNRVPVAGVFRWPLNAITDGSWPQIASISVSIRRYCSSPPLQLNYNSYELDFVRLSCGCNFQLTMFFPLCCFCWFVRRCHVAEGDLAAFSINHKSSHFRSRGSDGNTAASASASSSSSSSSSSTQVVSPWNHSRVTRFTFSDDSPRHFPFVLPLVLPHPPSHITQSKESLLETRQHLEHPLPPQPSPLTRLSNKLSPVWPASHRTDKYLW